MERFNLIKTKFKGVKGYIDLYIDGITISYVNVDKNIIEGYRTVTASCGCCPETIDWEGNLSHELKYMNFEEFDYLIHELIRLKLTIPLVH